MKRSLTIAALLASMLFAETNPFLGVWTMNLRKSKYPHGALPKSMVVRMEAAPGGIHYHSDTTGADNRVTQADYVADYSGKEATVRGVAGILAPVSLQRLDANTVVASYIHGGQVIATSRRSISKDGRIMTISTTSKDKDGNSVTNTGVYERARP